MQSNSGNVNSASTSGGSGMAPNMAAALSYLLGLVTGIVFLMIEKENSFVRFHAYQSILLSVAWVVFWIAFSIVSSILGMIPIIGFLGLIVGLLISLGLGLGGFILWIMLLVKAYQGQQWKLPYIGDMAERYATPS
ncbi:MAG: DUF4870 domain-containing protein [Chloroflexota bacterium]|jgi:uncharacterized membrane protein